MNKKLKRVASLTVAAFISASALAGCTGTDKNKGTGTAATTQTGTPAPEKKGPSWTWDTSPLTVTMFVMDQSYSKRWDTANCLLDQQITKDTGITVDISSGNVDKLNVMIASDALTDIVSMDDYNAKSQRLQLENGNKLWPLNEIMEKYAPDLKAPKSMMDWYRNPNGNWYTFVGWFFAAEEMTKDNYYSSHNYNMVRKDIMDQLGIKREDFETQEGFINALKKVKSANVQYKGTAVAPYYSYMDTNSKNGIVYDFAEQFGMLKENKDGTLADERKHPKMLEGAKFANRLYREGLLPEDYFTLKADQINNKIKAGSVFAYTRAGNTTASRTQLYNSDNNANFIFMKPIKGADGAATKLLSNSPTGWNKTVISKKAKNPDRIIRFFSYMYSEDTLLNELFGAPKGVAWNLVDGHVQYTDQFNNDVKNDPKSATTKYGKATFSFWTTSVIKQKFDLLTATGYDKINVDEFKANVSPYIINSMAFADITPAPGSDEDVLYKKVDEYVKEQQVKMVLAKSSEEVEAIFNETVKKMDDMGWKKVYDVMNKNFQDNKKKLGLKSVYTENK